MKLTTEQAQEIKDQQNQDNKIKKNPLSTESKKGSVLKAAYDSFPNKDI